MVTEAKFEALETLVLELIDFIQQEVVGHVTDLHKQKHLDEIFKQYLKYSKDADELG